MTHAAALEQVRRSLVSTAGGYLRNILHIDGVTCSMCAQPIEQQYTMCARCLKNYSMRSDTAKLVGSMTYGMDNHQTARVMYGYKSNTPGPSHVPIVTSLAVLGIRGHHQCIERLAGAPATRWATVPSTRRIGTEHRFRAILARNLNQRFEIEVAANPSILDPREVTPSNFEIRTPPEGAHVLVVDDTWVGGGHAQSVAAALSAAGASRVSILTVARWLKPEAQDEETDVTRRVIRERIKDRAYDPTICPWTGGDCPT
ncbi:MAG: hypothetical protein VX424_12705 [Actinomycetota bacterium]|nr:hypothetical protein [Actinomycetota bacterium]